MENSLWTVIEEQAMYIEKQELLIADLKDAIKAAKETLDGGLKIDEGSGIR